MSSIFVVCRLIHAELEEILFTRFIFSFPHYMRLATVQKLTNTISPRACTLLREVMAIIHFDGRGDEYPLQKQEALTYLKRKLPGLKKVHLAVGFVAAPLDGVLVKRRRDGFADMIMEFVISFASGIEVVVTNSDSQQCGKGIMQAFDEKVEELMASSKMKAADYDIKVVRERRRLI
ncbi:c402288d-685e-49c0-b00b-cc9f63e5abae-CDS [Sclerotinia trifoliorum]|uniref:C402288d-685e-49c0-b00b-cc9f63e5abae-CDS n=1 Tax=Sclerotinia trifoliorum TaxID=28548 RepID=A0A8H2VWN4_9HELO|nr:c402288d-685e-49c0-b00b-cc9f63e5abae-CDS [Sclerotinia trifoliorum]